MSRDRGKWRFLLWWLPCAVLFLAVSVVVLVTAIQHQSFRWKPGPDPRDDAGLILGGTSVTHVFEMKSDPRDADYPRSVGTRGQWGVPGVFDVMDVPPPKLPPGERGWVMSMRYITIELWPLLVALGIPTIAGAVKAWKRHRLGPDPNLCPFCGYDLRATPERCPECGAMPLPGR